MIFAKKKPQQPDQTKRTFANRLEWRQILWRHKSAIAVGRPRPRKITPKLNKKNAFAVLIFSASLIGIVILISNIRITRVECQSQFGKCPEDVDRLTQQLIGMQSVSLNLEKTKSELSQSNTIHSISAKRRGISGILVEVVVRVPLGNIQSDISGSNARIIDEEGYVIKNEGSAILSSLVVENWSDTSKKATPEQVVAVKALEEIKKISNRKSIGTLNGLELTASTGDGPKIIINLEKPFESWLSSLQVILERSRISSKQPEKIDLRFNNPVLVYSK